LLSEDSYLLEVLQSADKTKTHAKAELQNAPTFTDDGDGRHSHVCLQTFTKLNQNTDTLCNKNLYLPVV